MSFLSVILIQFSVYCIWISCNNLTFNIWFHFKINKAQVLIEVLYHATCSLFLKRCAKRCFKNLVGEWVKDIQVHRGASLLKSNWCIAYLLFILHISWHIYSLGWSDSIHIIQLNRKWKFDPSKAFVHIDSDFQMTWFPSQMRNAFCITIK